MTLLSIILIYKRYTLFFIEVSIKLFYDISMSVKGLSILSFLISFCEEGYESMSFMDPIRQNGESYGQI